ncbi:MAG: HAD family hydrolase [Verrucomicrobia bacterium]|nr:HAD family hydrolase [Verrucomicrobiota bacterium]
MTQKAVFLDRDGVLVHDRGLLTSSDQFELMNGVPCALRQLKENGFRLIVVTNQAVVARGMLTEKRLAELHDALQQLLLSQNGPVLDAIYACPHHPNADLPAFRIACECRKPMPGMLLKAALEHRIDLKQSFMIGDRTTDVVAGFRAGCRTILLETGQHNAAPIETASMSEETILPDWREPHIGAALKRIISTL